MMLIILFACNILGAVIAVISGMLFLDVTPAVWILHYCFGGLIGTLAYLAITAHLRDGV